MAGSFQGRTSSLTRSTPSLRKRSRAWRTRREAIPRPRISGATAIDKILASAAISRPTEERRK